MRAGDAVITVVDFEATGAVAGYADEPWQIGLVTLRGGTIDAQSIFGCLLRVGDRPFSRHAPGRHSELREEIRRAPLLVDLWPHLRPYLEATPLAGHNIGTEKRFLSAAFPMHIPALWIDTLKLARMAFPALASHRLEDVIRHAGLESRVGGLVPGATYHDAVYDAVAAAALLEAMLRIDGWQDLSLRALASARPIRYRTRAGRSSSPRSNGTV